MRSNPDPTAAAGPSPATARLRRSSSWGALLVAVAVFTAACGPHRSHAAVTRPAVEAEKRVAKVLQTVWAGLGRGDPAPLLNSLADDVQLHSPALIGPEYRGRQLVASIVTPAVQVLGPSHVTDVLRAGDGTTGSVVFDTLIGDEPAQGVVMVRTRGEQINDITLLIRPLPALRAFVARLAAMGATPAIDAGQG